MLTYYSENSCIWYFKSSYIAVACSTFLYSFLRKTSRHLSGSRCLVSLGWYSPYSWFTPISADGISLSYRESVFSLGAHQLPFSPTTVYKRAQRALGRSPEEKVKGHSGANNREPQGHNLNNFGRGPFDDVIY